MTDAVERLLAKDAIRDAAIRYCRGVDRCDEALVKSAYHPDAYDEHGTFKGNAWEFAAYVTATLRRRYQATMHVITNHSIDDVDLTAGTASGEIYCLAYHLRETPEGDLIDAWWGRYVDRYERRDGEWKISRRVVVHEWTKQIPVDQPMSIDATLYTPGSFDRR